MFSRRLSENKHLLRSSGLILRSLGRKTFLIPRPLAAGLFIVVVYAVALLWICFLCPFRRNLFLGTVVVVSCFVGGADCMLSRLSFIDLLSTLTFCNI